MLRIRRVISELTTNDGDHPRIQSGERIKDIWPQGKKAIQVHSCDFVGFIIALIDHFVEMNGVGFYFRFPVLEFIASLINAFPCDVSRVHRNGSSLSN